MIDKAIIVKLKRHHASELLSNLMYAVIYFPIHPGSSRITYQSFESGNSAAIFRPQ